MSEPGISFFHPFQAFHPARQTPRPSPVNPWLRGSGDTRYQVKCHVQESMQTMPNAHELHLIGEAPRGASRLALYDTGWADARCATRQHCGHPLRLSRTRALSILSDANFAISLKGWPESEPAVRAVPRRRRNLPRTGLPRQAARSLRRSKPNGRRRLPRQCLIRESSAR